MKKVLSFVLVLAMILGSVSLAFAAEFTDTKGTSYEEAARLLSDLGVISGKTATTFAPNDNVTRAEFVAMVVRALGFGQQPAAVTPFTEDVPASYWASGYIKVANELGITFGKSATRFAPKDNVTNDEMIAMVIRALGYKVEYLQGNFPSAQINQALQLDILEGIPTGSAPAIRGDVAQLLYNALGQRVVSYDGNGNIIPGGTTLAQRCGAVAYDPDGGVVPSVTDPGDPFVVTGSESSAMNLKPYIGAYVTAYSGKTGTASEGKIIAVEAVASEFITVALSSATAKAAAPAGVAWTALLADEKLGDYKLKTDANDAKNPSVVAGFVYFENGVPATAGSTSAAKTAFDGETYTFAVKTSGNYVTKIYSANLWDEDAAAQVAADDLEELEDDALLGEDFALTNKDARDENSYEILGVGSVEEIKADNVVAVYTNRAATNRTIVRIEVGTKTVTGTISRINRTQNTITIGGTAYKLSGLTGGVAIGALNTGDKGVFYLDYQGNIYAFDEEETTRLYAVVLDQNIGAKGLNGATPKVRLFTEEGKAVTYVAIDDLVDYDGANDWDVDGKGTTIKANDVITFALNNNGQVSKITKLFSYNTTTPAVAANTPVTKSGTIEVKASTSEVITANTVLFAYDAKDKSYSVVKRADLLGKNVNDYQSDRAATAGAAKVAVVQGVAGSDKMYYAFKDWAFVDDDYDYEFTFIDETGKDTVFLKANNLNDFTGGTNKAFDPATAETVGLFELTVNNDNAITAGTYNKTADDTCTVANDTTCKKTGDVYIFEDTNNTGKTPVVNKTMTLASDVLVLVKQSNNTWAVKTTTALKGLAAGKVVDAFDTDSTSDSVYDVVFVH